MIWQKGRLLQFCNSVTFKAVLAFQGFWNQVHEVAAISAPSKEKGSQTKHKDNRLWNVTAMRCHGETSESDRDKRKCLPI